MIEEIQIKKQIECPGCGAMCEPDAKICVVCGTDLVTGAAIDTIIEHEEEEIVEPVDPAWVGVLTFCINLMPGLVRPKVLIISLIVGVIGLIVLALSPIFMAMGVFITAVAVGGAGLVVWAQAMAWMLCGDLGLLQDILADFDEGQWTRFGLLVMLPLALWVTLMVLESKAGTI